jgi:hypothetical protein
MNSMKCREISMGPSIGHIQCSTHLTLVSKIILQVSIIICLTNQFNSKYVLQNKMLRTWIGQQIRQWYSHRVHYYTACTLLCSAGNGEDFGGASHGPLLVEIIWIWPLFAFKYQRDITWVSLGYHLLGALHTPAVGSIGPWTNSPWENKVEVH